MRSGEGADGRAGARETVATGGAEVFREVEGFEGIGFEGGDFGRGGVAEKRAEEGDEAADEGAVGFAAEKAAAGANFADEVNEGDAAAHAVGIGAFGVGEGRELFGAVDDGAEAFLGIVDEGEIVDEVLEFFGEGHGDE